MADDVQGVSHETFFHDVLQCVRLITAERYKITKISIRSIGTGASRLSSPIEITGFTKKGKKIRYFGKIIGNSDVFTFRSIQYLKNVYLQLHDMDPIFGVFETPEEMAQDQYQMLKAIHTGGIPTPKPYSCYQINDSLWLLVTEYLDAKPLSSFDKIEAKQIDMAFSYIQKMHNKKIFHGDLKPDNIMVSRKIYILDVGHLRRDAPKAEKQAYDLACALCSFFKYLPVDELIRIAKKHYSLKKLREAMNYIELVQMRPDIHFNDEMKTKLIFHLSTSPRRFRRQKK